MIKRYDIDGRSYTVIDGQWCLYKDHVIYKAVLLELIREYDAIVSRLVDNFYDPSKIDSVHTKCKENGIEL